MFIYLFIFLSFLRSFPSSLKNQTLENVFCFAVFQRFSFVYATLLQKKGYYLVNKNINYSFLISMQNIHQ